MIGKKFHFLKGDFCLIVRPVRFSYHENMQDRQPLSVDIDNFKAHAGGAFYEEKSLIHGYISVSSIVMGQRAQGKRY